jgi:photosystem II stability/assembly factor-like uncharacterized protein
MKHLLLSLILFAAFLIPTQAQPYMKPGMVSVQGQKPTLQDLQRSFNNYWDTRDPDVLHEEENAEEGGYQQFKREEAFMKQRTFPTGEFPRADIIFTEYQKLKSSNANARLGNGGNTTQSANWIFKGPHVVPGNGGGAGRLNCMAFDPTNSNTIWIGAACGGLWKSTNGGSSWTSNTDLLPSLSVSEIVIDPTNTNIMYIATGDKYGIYYGYEVWGHYSAGVLKSTDGGLTWNQSGMNYNQWNGEIIQRLIMDNTNPDVLYAATYSGIYKTTNGGTSWTNLRTGSYYDIEFKPGTPATMYASDSIGFLRSTDSGANWSYVPSITTDGRTSIAVTPANPSLVYVWGVDGGFNYSNNSGTSFSPRTDPQSEATPYGHYDYVMTVSPVNENLLFVGGLSVARSTDGGQSWLTVSDWSGWPAPNYCHADNHDLEFAPGSSQVIYSCNDGGIFKSTDQGNSWTDLSGGVDIKQYYRFSSSWQNPNVMFGGAQDNGSDKITGINSAVQVNGADGEDCLVDWANDNIVFVSSQGGYFYKSTDGGNSFNPANVFGSDWTSPIVMDPSNHMIIYVGSSSVEKSIDNGNTFNSMNVGFPGAVYSIRVAPSNSNYVYAASFGTLQRTTNGNTWTDITNNLPVNHAAITGIAIDSDDPNRVWICFSGYSENNKVYQSDDGGTTWLNISGRLPNIPINCIEYQKNSEDILYIGTDLGVFYAAGSLNEWQSYNTGLPNVIIYDLDTHYPTGKLRTATFGRGIWESDTMTVTHPSLDAGTSGIISPLGETCDSTLIPIVRIRNIGTTTLTSANIHYHVDNQPEQVYAWTGNLVHLASADITLPVFSVTGGSHIFYAYTTDPNGNADMHNGNDSAFSTITILSNPSGIQAPFSEGFVSTSFPPPTWSLENSENIWQRSTAAGGFGLSGESAKANFWSTQTGEDKIISSYIDFSNLVAPITLTFDVAYRPYPGYYDSLIVDLANECDVASTRIYAKGSTDLGTTASGTSQFIPLPGEWRTETVNLDQYAGHSALELRFIGKSGFGNYLYLDNINLNGINVGVQELQTPVEDNVSVFPNPASSILYVEAASAKSNSMTVTVMDIFGKTVKEIQDVSFHQMKRYTVDISDLASGIYIVRTSSDVMTLTKKIQVTN